MKLDTLLAKYKKAYPTAFISDDGISIRKGEKAICIYPCKKLVKLYKEGKEDLEDGLEVPEVPQEVIQETVEVPEVLSVPEVPQEEVVPVTPTIAPKTKTKKAA